MDPSAKLDQELAEGIVVEKAFLERLESQAQHSQEVLDEDDAFLGVATTEVWEYEIVDSRRAEFEEAVRNSEVAFEVTIVDDSATTEDDLTESDAQPVPPVFARENEPEVVSSAGSGVAATPDDGPAGLPTGDPSAGGQSTRHSRVPSNEVEGIGTPGSGIDELRIVDAQAGTLGLVDPDDPDKD